MQTKAVVIATNGKFATVQSERKSACDGCHKAQEGGCSVCSLMGGDRKIATKALNSIGAKIGDTVMIESNSTRMLAYGILVFILPIVVALIAWGIVSQVTANIAIQAAISFAAFFLFLFGVAIYSKKVLACRCAVEIVEVISNQDTK